MSTPNTHFRRVVLTIVILIQAYSASFGADLPQPVQNLVDKRQEAISRIDKVFIGELEKVKSNYTKAGDLDNANLVAALIKQTKESDGSFSPGGSDAPISIEDKLVGRWLIYDTDHPKVWSGVITITKDLAYSCNGTFGANGYQNGNVVIKKENNKILIGPYEFSISNISSGKIFTRNAGPRTMERIK